MSKPYTGAKSVNDALADCLELAEVMREIQVTRDKVEEIDDVLAQMDEADARILRLWYIERKSKEEIASTTSATKLLCASLSSTSARGLCRPCKALSRLFSCIEKKVYGNLHFPRAIIEA